MLTRIRDFSDRLFPMKLSTVLIVLILFGSSITIQLGYIVALFTFHIDFFKNLALLLLITRFLYVPGGLYIIMRLGGSSYSHYPKLADMDHLKKNRILYIPLYVMILLDSNNVILLPWLSTKFSSLSYGYPDMYVFKISLYIKIVHVFILVVVQFAVLGQLYTYNMPFASLNIATQLFLLISIASSVISIILTIVGVSLQTVLLKLLLAGDNNSTSDTSGDNNIRNSNIEMMNPLGAIRIGK